MAAQERHLRAAGHGVTTLVATNPTTPVATMAVLSAAPDNPVAARRVSEAVARLRPDIVHVHNTWFALSPAVLAAARSSGAAVVATLHNYRLVCVNGVLYRDGGVCTDCVGHGPWRGVIHRCYRDSAAASAVVATTTSLHRRRGTWNDVDVLVTPSAFAREQLVTAGLPPDRLVVVPNAVEDPGPRPVPPSRSATVLYVGRLTREKGLDDVLTAWDARRPRGLELVVLGDGPVRGEFERRAVPGVRFAGRVPAAQVRHHMLSARALVFPSGWYEPFGLSLVEAMAAGTPVLATPLGAPPELLGDPPAGWVVSETSVSAWSDVLSVLDDGVALDARGQLGRETWAARYAPEVATKRLLETYEIARG